MASYALAIVLAFVNQWFADILFILVAFMWIVPDTRLEKVARCGQSDGKGL
jgi:hypothetical protein